MLALARKHHPTIVGRLGYDNVQFLESEIQNLKGLVKDESMDVVISNCVLNLVHPDEKAQLFAEIFRVLKPTGRAVISDIVSNKAVPEHLQKDPQLWSGCISGALEEHAFQKAFEDVGFRKPAVLSRQDSAWQTVEDIEFRSLTVTAYKAKSATLPTKKSSCC